MGRCLLSEDDHDRFGRGDEIRTQQANCNVAFRLDQPGWQRSTESFDLRDMLGNVWESVDDGGNDSAHGAPEDGSP